MWSADVCINDKAPLHLYFVFANVKIENRDETKKNGDEILGKKSSFCLTINLLTVKRSERIF